MATMRNTIKNHKDFAMADDDATARCAYCLIRARHVRFPGDPQYGLVATKRTFKHAVERNRAKRLLRDWIRANLSNMRNDLDYVFIARPAILDATRPQGVEALRKAFYYLGRTMPPAPKNNNNNAK